ncbi:hypothetical protein BJV82DRAFT_604321 [Fennellomyces sp. T-0311]|nr:hypothetical protein BJV82DRAFT_604321 [Fennellomyces sp. T-0311]
MASVNDSHMVLLGGSKRLTTIDLENLPNLTDEGVQAIVSIEYSSVQILKVKACEYVTTDYVQYEKRKSALH